LDAVGLLDESFTGYGGDDEDWCLRALAKGFKLGITGKVKVKHGFGDRKYSSSFYRVMTAQQRDASLTRMRRQVQETHSA
jgi:GT2 family glycosyltransferase